MPPAKKAAAKRSPPRAVAKASASAKRPTRKSPRKASRASRTAPAKPAPARPAAPARKAAAAKGAKKPAPPKAASRKATPRKNAGRKSPARKPAAARTLRFGALEPEAARRTTRLLESVTADRVLVENVNHPGHTTTVDGPKYRAMRRALLKILPKEGRGMTENQMFRAVKPHLPEKLFPGGAKAEWWVKCVQLDLEAKGQVVRDADAKPLRWRSAAGPAAGAKPAAAPPVRKRPLDRLKSAIIEREMTEAAAKQSREKPVPTASDLPGTLGTVPAPRKRLPAAKAAPPAKRRAAAKKAPPAKRKAAAKPAAPAKRKPGAKKARRR